MTFLKHVTNIRLEIRLYKFHIPVQYNAIQQHKLFVFLEVHCIVKVIFLFCPLLVATTC